MNTKITELKTVKNCPVCNQKLTLSEIVKLSNPGIDNSLCRKHLFELLDLLKKRRK